MKRRRHLFFIFLFSMFLLLSQVSFGKSVGGTFSGSDLLTLCKLYVNGTSLEDIAKGNGCSGFVLGIDDAHSLFVQSDAMEKQWCSPKNASTMQLVRIVLKALEEHPEDLHLGANRLTANAFVQAFPCN